jgi:transcriptional activator of cad operon
MRISSLTCGTNAPRPKSERLSVVVASKPTVGSCVRGFEPTFSTVTSNEEPFADGMTEELIHKLSKVPGLRVPAPTASFYFKGKQLSPPEIAKSLRVTYVLDGSVRKSGETLRVAARLLRADDGYVVWSETYDRPLDHKLMVQDDIAGEVTSALRRSID